MAWAEVMSAVEAFSNMLYSDFVIKIKKVFNHHT